MESLFIQLSEKCTFMTGFEVQGHIQVWNGMRVTKRWQNVIFVWTNPVNHTLKCLDGIALDKKAKQE